MAQRKSVGLLVVVATIMVLSVSGCGELARVKVIGNWEADLTQANVGTFGINTQPSDNPFRNVVNSIIKDTAQGVSGTFNAKESIHLKYDGTFTASMTVQGKQISSSNGTWDISKTAGDQVTIRLNHAGTNAAQEFTVKMIGSDQFESAPLFGATGGKSATFRRVSSS